jgi:hypothetical protein
MRFLNWFHGFYAVVSIGASHGISLLLCSQNHCMTAFTCGW